MNNYKLNDSFFYSQSDGVVSIVSIENEHDDVYTVDGTAGKLFMALIGESKDDLTSIEKLVNADEVVFNKFKDSLTSNLVNLGILEKI
jgi:hypothetical protein